MGAYERTFVRFTQALRAKVPLSELTAQLAKGKKPNELKLDWTDPTERRASAAWSELRVGISRAWLPDVRAGEALAREQMPQRVDKARRKPRREPAVPQAPKITVGINPHSLEWIREEGARRVVQVSRQTREAVREIVRVGYANGTRPEELARQIKRTVGLTARQAAAVENRRAALLARGADPDKADRMSERYADTQLAYRAEAIARTEQIAAQNHGQQDAWLQARDEGDLPARTRRRWATVHGERTCEHCEAMDRQTVKLDEPFVSETLGVEVETPPLHPMCRCMVVLDFGK